jgi:hypothetical protein
LCIRDRANAVDSRWGMRFNDVVEAPDGTLFAAGSNSDIIANYYPSILVAKFSADGALINHVLIGNDPSTPDELPNAGGDTPYDAAAQIVWTDDGPCITGTTGLGPQTAGWVAGLTDELGVRFFSAFDGSRAESFLDMAATADGLNIMGWSDSVMPFGTGGQHAIVLLKYPWEGIMRMHPDTGVQTHYLQPRIYLSSEQLDFMSADLTSTNPVTRLTAPAPFGYQEIVWTVVSTPVPPIGSNITPVMARLEFVEPTAVKNFAEWTAYHQLSAANSTLGSDSDGDGRSNAEEFFYGTNPFVQDTSPRPTVSIERDGANLTAVIHFEHASWATFPMGLIGGGDLNVPLRVVPGSTYTAEEQFQHKIRAALRHSTQNLSNMFYRVSIQPQ